MYGGVVSWTAALLLVAGGAQALVGLPIACPSIEEGSPGHVQHVRQCAIFPVAPTSSITFEKCVTCGYQLEVVGEPSGTFWLVFENGLAYPVCEMHRGEGCGDAFFIFFFVATTITFRIELIDDVGGVFLEWTAETAG